jgi:hypothetical protein
LRPGRRPALANSCAGKDYSAFLRLRPEEIQMGLGGLP